MSHKLPKSVRKSFLLRVDPEVLAAVQERADEDGLSLNAKIGLMLRQAVRPTPRAPAPPEARPPEIQQAAT